MSKLGDLTPHLRVEEGKEYTVEMSSNSAVAVRDSDFGPVYDITVLHNGNAKILSGGQNLADQVLDMAINTGGEMFKVTVRKDWVEQKDGTRNIVWTVD